MVCVAVARPVKLAFVCVLVCWSIFIVESVSADDGRRSIPPPVFSAECQAIFHEIHNELAELLSTPLASPNTPLFNVPLGTDHLSVTRAVTIADAVLRPFAGRLFPFHKINAEFLFNLQIRGDALLLEFIVPGGTDMCALLTRRSSSSLNERMVGPDGENPNSGEGGEPGSGESSDDYGSSEEAWSGFGRQLGKKIRQEFRADYDELQDDARAWLRSLFELEPQSSGSGGGPTIPGGPSSGGEDGESSPWFNGLRVVTKNNPFGNSFLGGISASLYDDGDTELEGELLYGLFGNDNWRASFTATQETAVGRVSLGVYEGASSAGVTVSVNISM